MSTTRAIEEYFGKTPEELSRMWKEEEIRRLAKAEIAKENLFWKRYKEKVKK